MGWVARLRRAVSRLLGAPTKAIAYTALAATVGFALRMSMAQLGHNYDYDSFRIVAAIMRRGGNVYLETTRYNYAPAWFWVLHALDSVSVRLSVDFRALLVATLALADICIVAILFRRLGPCAAIAYALNPVSIIITGFHNQFDNVAILVGLLALPLLERERPGKGNAARWLAGLGLLGVSLVIKHVLFLFPVWVAIRSRGFGAKAVSLLVPYGVFALSFAPCWATGSAGIRANVFAYASWQNAPFFRVFVPEIVQRLIPARLWWYACLTASALLFRKYPLQESYAVYLAVMFGFSPSIANQYLILPLLFFLYHARLEAAMYWAISSWLLLWSPEGFGFASLGVPDLSSNVFYAVLATVVVYAVCWLKWRTQIVWGYKWLLNELRVQLGLQAE